MHDNLKKFLKIKKNVIMEHCFLDVYLLWEQGGNGDAEDSYRISSLLLPC